MGIYSHTKAKHDIISKRSQNEVTPQNDAVKRKSWSTPYGHGDFKSPITYEEACKHLKALQDHFFPKDK